MLQLRTTPRKKIPFITPCREGTLIGQIKLGYAFGVVECDISVSENMKSKFADCPSVFKIAWLEENPCQRL